MQLIGMLDSPYVRRVAVTLKLLNMPFEHHSISVFRQFDAFATINPVVKAPSFVTDDGTVLMDSTLILEHITRISGNSLMPDGAADHARSLRLIGLAMAACEKSVSIVYERNQRPAEKLHEPWLDRVKSQLRTAYGALETEMPDGWFTGGAVQQPDLTTAVAWRFTQYMAADAISPGDFPRLAALSARAEKTQAFRETDF